MTADSSGSVRVMVGNWSDGRPARGSWWGIKRIEGRCLCGVEPSAALSLELSWSLGRGVVVGVGPALLRTESWGAAVSARVLVMSTTAGDAGGESFGGRFWCRSGWFRGAVWRLDGGEGRADAPWDPEVAAKGEAGGVWVEARGRVLGERASSRGPSGLSAECRCRPWV